MKKLEELIEDGWFELDELYDTVEKLQEEIEQVGLYHYGKSNYYFKHPEEYAKDKKIADLECEVERLSLTEKALELACEQIWAMSIWENTKEEVIQDNIEYFKTKAKEMMKSDVI